MRLTYLKLNYDKSKHSQTTSQTTLRVPPVVSEPPVEKHVWLILKQWNVNRWAGLS